VSPSPSPFHTSPRSNSSSRPSRTPGSGRGVIVSPFPLGRVADPSQQFVPGSAFLWFHRLSIPGETPVDKHGGAGDDCLVSLPEPAYRIIARHPVTSDIRQSTCLDLGFADSHHPFAPAFCALLITPVHDNFPRACCHNGDGRPRAVVHSGHVDFDGRDPRFCRPPGLHTGCCGQEVWS